MKQRAKMPGSRRLIRAVLRPVILLAAIQSAMPGPAAAQSRSVSNDRISTARAVKVGLNKSFSVELPGDVREVIISDPNIVEAVVRSTRRVHLIGQKVGQASASFIDRDGHQLMLLDISVERSLAPVEALIRRFVPNANVRLETINDNIVLMGTVASPLDATRIADIAGRFVSNREQVLNMVEVEAKEQVLLRVKVVEMNRSVIRRLGIDTQAALANGSLAIAKISQTGFPLTAGTIPALLRGSGSGDLLAAHWGNSKVEATAMIEALERNGLARTLAEPNLTSVSGETANFLAGGEYPVPVGNKNDGSTQITFKTFGVGLSFTPVVLSEGRISLQIRTDVSELTNEGAVTISEISIPALRVRRASSTLELPSGGSLVMAGLISSQTQRNIDGLPGLRQLPVIGELFRSEEFVRSETELVVMVTPMLVRPSAEGKLTVPGDPGVYDPPSPGARDSKVWLQDRSVAGFGYIIE